MTLITREQFSEALKHKQHIDVPVPELGDDMELRVVSFSAGTKGQVENIWSEKFKEGSKKDTGGIRVAVLARSIEGPDGSLMFVSKDKDGNIVVDNEGLAEMLDGNAGLIERLFEAASELNGYTQQDVEDLEKN